MNPLKCKSFFTVLESAINIDYAVAMMPTKIAAVLIEAERSPAK